MFYIILLNFVTDSSKQVVDAFVVDPTTFDLVVVNATAGNTYVFYAYVSNENDIGPPLVTIDHSNIMLIHVQVYSVNQRPPVFHNYTDIMCRYRTETRFQALFDSRHSNPSHRTYVRGVRQDRLRPSDDRRLFEC